MCKVDILNKKILYISNIRFHYDQFLVNKLTELGGIVDQFDIVVKSSYFKAKLGLQNAKTHESNYYNQILNKSNYDYVLVRFGYQLEAGLLRKLRLLNPNAKFINFHWDSLRPEYNYLPIINHFDKVFSFDYKDCRDHARIEYLPLFYIDKYATNNYPDASKKDIDVLFIGGWRSNERYHLIKLTERICRRNNLRFHYYLQSSYYDQFYSFYKQGIIQKEAHAKRLTHDEILKYFAISKSVIDFPSSFQTGLTIRCFETLAAQLRLITTNVNIISEPFFNPGFIDVIDINNIRLNVDFIRNTRISSMEGSIRDYSIGNYAKKLLG